MEITSKDYLSLSGAVAFWTFWLNYAILKLKGNRIRHNSKKSVRINIIAVYNRKIY